METHRTRQRRGGPRGERVSPGRVRGVSRAAESSGGRNYGRRLATHDGEVEPRGVAAIPARPTGYASRGTNARDGIDRRRGLRRRALSPARNEDILAAGSR